MPNSNTNTGDDIVSLADAKLYLRVDVDDDDDLITDLIVTCRQICENTVRRSFLPTVYQITLERFPSLNYSQHNNSNNLTVPNRMAYGIQLPFPPLIQVNYVKYVDPSGVMQLLDPSNYAVEAGGVGPGMLYPASGKSWPAVKEGPDAVQINVTDGYTTVPSCARTAVKLMLGHLYRNREATSAEGLKEIPMGVRRCLAPLMWGSYV